MIDHPFLRKSDRLRAYQDLLFKPSGTYREWADRWGWTLPRVHRFLASLEREGLANVRRTRFGTTVELRSLDRNKTVTQPELAHSTGTVTQPERDRDATVREPERLGSAGRETGLGSRPSSRSIDEQNQEPADNYTVACIDTMNQQLSRLFGDEYRRVRYTSQKSNETVDRWKVAGIELEFAVEEIRKACLKFNPAKHGGGKLPGQLGYFGQGVLDAHARRNQTGLSLPPVVQRGGAPRETRRARSQPVPLAAALPTAMEAFMETKQAGARRRS